MSDHDTGAGHTDAGHTGAGHTDAGHDTDDGAKTGLHHLTRDDAAYVARLARIDLDPEELETYATQLAAVLDHAAQVAALDTSEVEPTAHPLPLENVLREDQPQKSLDREEVLAEAPATESGRFKVPRVLGDAP